MHAKKQHVCALQALGHQGHQDKHFASFHSQPEGCEFWVFRFWVSRRRFNLLPGLPCATIGWAFAAGCSRRYRLLLARPVVRELNFAVLTDEHSVKSTT
jgi:hypothetical protein